MAIVFGTGGSYSAAFAGPFGSLTTPVRLVEVTLPVSQWKNGDSPFFQTVTIPGISALSKVDLLPSAAQLEAMRSQELALTTENTDGTVTVYAIGSRPMEDITLQAVITEVTL